MSLLKVCACASYPASAEPRARRHAVTLAKMNKEFNIIFVDCVPRGQNRMVPREFSGLENLVYITHYFPHRKSGAVRLFAEKLSYFFSRALFLTFGLLYPSALSTRAIGLEKLLKGIDADVYIGYNIDTLLPIYRVAKDKRSLIIFDCQEYYSDMGEWQTPLEKEIIRCVESKCLPACHLVLTASDQLADELAKVYGIRRPLPLYNAPHIEVNLPEKDDSKFSLYWRNLSIGLGQRGLDDALAALKLLPEEITLHIQGKLPFDGGRKLRRKINELGLAERVVIHPPYMPHEAVIVGSRYTVGLCPERGGFRNQELTVSNKMFDYFMAGLAVIASDLPGLRDVITRSGGGLLFKSECPEDLAQKILTLYEDRELLARLASNARAFALSQGNLEHEMEKLRPAFSSLLKTPNLGSSALDRNLAESAEVSATNRSISSNCSKATGKRGKWDERL